MSIYLVLVGVTSRLVLGVSCTEDNTEKSHHDDYDDSEDENDGYMFNTLWPVMMMIIVAGIFIAVIYVICRRVCPDRCRRRRDADRNRPGEPEVGETDATSRPSRSYPRMRSTRYQDMADIWSVEQPPPEDAQWSEEQSMWTAERPGTDVAPVVTHMKPPPYCEEPPSYDDAALSIIYGKGYVNDGYTDPTPEYQSEACSNDITDLPSTSEPQPPPYCEHDVTNDMQQPDNDVIQDDVIHDDNISHQGAACDDDTCHTDVTRGSESNEQQHISTTDNNNAIEDSLTGSTL